MASKADSDAQAAALYRRTHVLIPPDPHARGPRSILEVVLNLGAPEIALIVVAVMLLFGYKKLPDASRSIGRSLRIFKGEMKGMKDDDVRAEDPATTTPGVGQILAPPPSTAATAASSASGDLSAQPIEEARLA
jgi:sec-independent protein translocase protein TatA